MNKKTKDCQPGFLMPKVIFKRIIRQLNILEMLDVIL